jgi:hypothetical protein
VTAVISPPVPNPAPEMTTEKQEVPTASFGFTDEIAPLVELGA